MHRRLERANSPEVSSLVSMETSIRRMEVLVNDLLNISSLETGVFTLHRQRCDIVELTQSLIDEYVLGTNPHPVIHVKLPPESIEVEVDVERIGQVILNLLSNARKYSSVGTPIHVTLERDARNVCISVRDSGVGIPADVLPQIFERFYRIPGTEVLTGSSIGFGLGLYISKQIVEHHGGRIEVESIPHEGSLFVIRLPLYTEPTITHLDAENHLKQIVKGGQRQALPLRKNGSAKLSVRVVLVSTPCHAGFRRSNPAPL